MLNILICLHHLFSSVLITIMYSFHLWRVIVGVLAMLQRDVRQIVLNINPAAAVTKRHLSYVCQENHTQL